nr:squalene monooxygenase-like [Coffea arabica]
MHPSLVLSPLCTQSSSRSPDADAGTTCQTSADPNSVVTHISGPNFVVLLGTTQISTYKINGMMRFNRFNSCFRSSIYSSTAANSFVHRPLPTRHTFPTSVSWNLPSPTVSRPNRPLYIQITNPKTKITTTTFPVVYCTDNSNTTSATTQNREPEGSNPVCSLANKFGLLRSNKQYKQKPHADRPCLDIRSNQMAVDECRTGWDSDTDVIIVGAGVVGAALSYTLGKEGRRVRVIERDLTEPDRIVGELLQPGGYLKLIELGLEDCVVNIDAQRVLGYALFKDGRSTRVSYPLENFHSDVAGRSFHHGRFIQRMREKAASLANVRLEQGTVTSLLEDDGTVKGVEYKTKSGKQLKAYAPLTIVCDGCFSNLRRSLCSSKIPAELHDAFVSAIDKGDIRTMPNRSMPAAPHPTPGALLLGDAFNMRHPLTGGGMTVALSDIVVLRDLLKPLQNMNDAESLCKYLQSFYTLRKPVASTINTLAAALYKVFCASSDQARKEMREACFDYLSLGGVCSDGPIALLSGLNPRPLSLVLHFFAVAAYAVGRLLTPFPSPRNCGLELD